MHAFQRQEGPLLGIIFTGEPDWNIKTLHRRMEDKIERNVPGIIGYMPKGDEVSK